MAVVCATVAASAVAQPRTQGRERQVFVSALDAAGKPVDSLDTKDVIVREDGIAREVLKIEKATQPMQLALLVDNSQTATDAIRDMRDALMRFVGLLGTQHEIAVISLAERPTILTDYTANRELLKKAIGRLFARPDAGTYLLEGIRETTRGLRKREAARPVIVALMTEGIEFSNDHYDPVLESLHESGAAFHVLVFDRPGAEPNTNETRNRGMVYDRGTRETGGRRETLLTSMAFPDELAKLASELSNQLVVTYGAPQTLIPPKRIEVRSAKEGLTVRGTPVRSKGDK
jgi:hypothetical protein